MNKTDDRKSLLRKFSKKKHPILIGFGILAIMTSHFVVQIFFIQTEQFQSVEVAVQTEKSEVEKPMAEAQKSVPQIIKIVPEVYEVQTTKVIKIPEKVKPTPHRQVEKIPLVQTQPEKKAVRNTKKETKAERLRRAEKILTGY